MSAAPHTHVSPAGASRRTAFAVAGVVAAMLGLAYASVPLYQMFCRVTGYGGTTQVATDAPARVGTREFLVRFDANVAPGLQWRFESETASIRLKAGETKTIFYKVTNVGPAESVGVAAYNVAPEAAGAWFNKIACFCFTEQRLAPGESLDMPVVFFLDPALEGERTMQDVSEITLSYTFFAPKGTPKGAPQGTPKAAAANGPRL